MIEKGNNEFISESLVAFKAKKVNGLYILLGSVSKDKDIVASIQNEYLALLWHNRFEHVSEKAYGICLSKVL